MKNNLWLCLTCGNLGCGWQYHDGTGGNGHAKNHYENSKHSVAVLYGTISEELNPSGYCYSC